MTDTSGTTPSSTTETPGAKPSSQATLTGSTPANPDTTARATLDTDHPAAEKILDAGGSAQATTTGTRQDRAGGSFSAAASGQPTTGTVADALRSGRETMSESRWETQYRTLRDQYDRLAAAVSEQGGDLGRRASEVYDRTADQIQRQGRRGLSAAQRPVIDYPLVSVLVAFGVGYLIGRFTSGTPVYGTDTDYDIEDRPYPYQARYSDTGAGAESGRYPYRARYTDAGSGTESSRYPYQARYTDRD